MRRIRREESHENFVKALTSGENPVFKEIWRLLVFAAAVGVRSGTRRQLGKFDPGKAINDTYFSVPGWRGLLYLIGVTEDGEAGALKADDAAEEHLATLFEEYANQGLYSLRELVQSSVSPLDDIVTMVLEKASTPADPPVVQDII
jgi:dnd system-associated protein 4